MGDAAEHIATRCGVTRADQDRFSAQSHKRAAAAWERGDFAAEIVPVMVGSGAKAKTVSRDEGIRQDSTPERLSTLRTAFRTDGTVTAVNLTQLFQLTAAA